MPPYRGGSSPPLLVTRGRCRGSSGLVGRLRYAQAGTRLRMTTTPRRRMRQNRILWLLDRLERDSRADAVINAIGRGVRALPLGRGRDALHGRWLGHPVHPLMVQVPIGS